jgi:hypothetical protein
MAHECPECGMWCHCGGDIDDCGHNFEEYQNACTHCPVDRIVRLARRRWADNVVPVQARR